MFFNNGTGVILETHAYDLYGTGEETALIAFISKLRKQLDLKSAVTHPIDISYEHLRPPRLRTQRGMLIKANPKYITKALSVMHMQYCAHAPTPRVKEGALRVTILMLFYLTENVHNSFDRWLC